MSFDLGISRLVSAPSFSGLAQDCHFTGFPEFERFYFNNFLLSTPFYLKAIALSIELLGLINY